MKINKSSWHYKLASSQDRKASQNLCTYFWEVVLALSLYALIPVSLAFVLFVAMSTVALPFVVHWYDIYAERRPWWIDPLVGAGIAGWSIAIIALIFASFYYPMYRKSTKPASKKNPSLLREYIKAKKQKICPMLEFEGEKQ